MEYFIIIILQFLGIGFHVMQKISEIGNLHKEKRRPEILDAFMREDWDTLIMSGLVLILNLVVHYILEEYAYEITEIKNYYLYTFALAFILGYAGQRLVYKYLGSAETFLNNKADNLK